MKILKSLLIVFSAILFISASSYSQDNRGPQKSPDVRAREVTDRLNKALTFTDGQDSLVYKVEYDFFNSLVSFGDNFKGSDDDKAKIMDVAKSELYLKMKIILTPEQLDKYDSLQQHQSEKRKGNWKNKHRDN